MRPVLLVTLIPGLLALTACKNPGLYCDEDTPCADRFPDKPFCDLHGSTAESMGVGKTCVSEQPQPDAGVFDAGPDPECTTAADCDDGVYCNGAEDCVGGACVAAATAIECDDGIACTLDACDEEADACAFLPQHALCTDPNLAYCDPLVGCRDQPCTLSSDCDDGLVCNGAETCVIPDGQALGSCLPGTAPTCDDGVTCTTDSCSVAMNRCVNTASNAACDNGLYCDGAETCHQTLDCQAGAAPNCPNSCNETEDRCNDCVPNGSTCAAGTRTICGADGRVASTETCILGCDAGGTRCLDVDPSNGLATYLDMTASAPSIVLANGSRVNTDNGEVRDPTNALISVPNALIPAPAGGVAVRVLMVNNITIGNVDVGSSTVGLAIVANGEVVINGVLDVGAEGTESGPGWGPNPSGNGSINFPSGTSYAGSGGAGFGTAGAAGGAVTGVNGGTPGSQAGSATLVPLRGGGRGGCSPLANTSGGGGALQIVSRTRIRLTGNGQVDASGGGGGWWTQHPSDPVNGTPGAGCGGGAGGGVLLEAPEVRIESGTGIHANGGGGGCAFAIGADGQFSAAGAVGATCVGSNRGNGGYGAARGTPDGLPGVGGAATSGSPLSGGGGGGAVGRIRVNTPVFNPLNGSILSPQPSQGALGTR